MTEDDAKTKWCPMVQVQPGPAMPGVYSSGCNNRGESCIGSTCMMWRWNKNVRPGDSKSDGYCGLAGKPE